MSWRLDTVGGIHAKESFWATITAVSQMELHHGSIRVSSSNEFLTLDWQHLFSFQLMASQEEKKCKLLNDFIP